MSKLVWVSWRWRSERKLFPPLLTVGVVFGVGQYTERAAARGSIGVVGTNMLVGKPPLYPPMGMPQKPVGLVADACVSRVSNTSPAYVGLPLQSLTPVGAEVSSTLEKSPLISAGVGINSKNGVACRTRNPS